MDQYNQTSSQGQGYKVVHGKIDEGGSAIGNTTKNDNDPDLNLHGSSGFLSKSQTNQMHMDEEAVEESEIDIQSNSQTFRTYSQQHQHRQHIVEVPPPDSSSPKIIERSPGNRYLRFSEVLGNGAYKSVYRAYDSTEGIEVAWNVVNLTGTPVSDRSRIINEVRLLERLSHENIISFYGSWVNREEEQVIFVTEILSSGTLKSFINKVQVIRWKIAKRWAKQILRGLRYLHEQQPPIIHRDLKCENIFINGTSGDLRIGDFGLSTNITNRTNKKAQSVLGTPEFMAPEMYDESYDEKVDIYAFGMCLLEIFTKEVPYAECGNPAQIYKKVTRGTYPQSLSRLRSQKAKEFIKLCLGKKVMKTGSIALSVDSTEDNLFEYQRPSALELLQHDFLKANGEDDEKVVDLNPPMQQMIIMESMTVSPDGFPDDKYAIPPTNDMTHIAYDNVSNEAEMVRETINEQEPPRNEVPISWNISEERTATAYNTGVSSAIDEMSFKADTSIVEEAARVTNGDIQDFNDKKLRSVISAETKPAPVQESESISLQSYAKAPLSDDDDKFIPPSLHEKPPALSVPPPKYILAANAEKPINPHNNNDNVIKLTITLPIDGKKQHVQFDFHLVEDEPVQVAREMVTELNIPETAILEISEIISGLARQARVEQQDAYMKQQMQLNLKSNSQPSTVMNNVPPRVSSSQNVNSKPEKEDTHSHGLTHEENILNLDDVDLHRHGVSESKKTQGTLHLGNNDQIGQDSSVHATTPNLRHVQEVSVDTNKNMPELLLMDMTHDSDTDSDDSNSDERKRLQEEYEKNVLHATKAYDTRMDNLQRSMEVKEQEHQKTIEKHEKNRLEFEKRKKLAESEQLKRLDELKQQWEEEIKKLKKQKSKKLLKFASRPLIPTGDLIELSPKAKDDKVLL